jgi:glycosyltransferase involved in cell wall biosynthesis
VALGVTPAGRRLLFLLPFAPSLDARHGGSKVTGELLAGLGRRGHEVAALCLVGAEDPPFDARLLDACALLERYERGAPPADLRSRVAAKIALLRGTPTWAIELREPGFAARAAELAADWRPDVVQLEFPVMGQYLAALDGTRAPRVLVVHDATGRDLRPRPGISGRLNAVLDARAWRRFEPRVLARVDAAVVFTDRDRRALERLRAGTRVVEIPVGTEIPQHPFDPVGESPSAIVFVGNFEHGPNLDAALWLAQTIFPPLRAAHPEVRLTIVGKSPPPELTALASEAVEVTGEVPEVGPYLNRAAVVTAPIRTGGGMRIKVLEALAGGKAVVATPLAVEGLDVSDGDQLEVAATADQLRASISRLLADQESRRALGERARAWASQTLGWDASIARYEALYRSLLAGERPGG